MRVVVALGGNALEAADVGVGLTDTAAQLAELVAEGHEVVITHGNGPQVGELLLDQEARGVDRHARAPLDVLVAMTQAQLGYRLQQAIEDELIAHDDHTDVVTIITEVVVHQEDPAFEEPTKPIGPKLSERPDDGRAYVRTSDGRWRRLVASPEPVHVVEHAALRAIIEDGIVPICAGGGGIPVVRDGVRLRGVEAVIDKDLAAVVLARAVGADVLVIATDVENAVVGYGTPEARPIGRTTPTELAALAEEGHFASGSMGPKVEAVRQFVAGGGSLAVITTLDRIDEAVDGDVGTAVHPDHLASTRPDHPFH